MIKYLGSKRLLIPAILDVVRKVDGVTSVADIFSGTSRVGFALKSEGYKIHANDHNTYAATIAKCYIEANRDTETGEVKELLVELQDLDGSAGWFTENYCEKARYFQPHNGAKIDAMREKIQTWSSSGQISDTTKAVLLTSLMEAADRVDSTTGVQMAFLKNWAKRSYNEIELRLPDLLPLPDNGPCLATQLDAVNAAKTTTADLAYIDPPYNQHKYLGNYHIWESLVLWDKPEVYGIARKRVDCRERRSEFNSKPRFLQTFEELINSAASPRLLVSFSNEGYASRDEIIEIMGVRGEVKVYESDYKRYVGAQIGIHNQNGKKVGTVGHLRNIEYLFLV
jgi:adenine-specific DNA-methyltransferase